MRLFATRSACKTAAATLALAFGLVAASACHAAYPDKPVKLVVAFAPGSSTDIVARLLAERLTVTLGQTVVVENKPGASGNLATQQIVAAPADGYTLLIHSVAIAVNPSLFASAGYDTLRDLAPVAMAAVTPNMVYVHPDVPARNLAELLSLARTSKLSYASSGIGTTTHLGAEWLFRALEKVDIVHVPFQPAAATNAVVSGQVQVASTSMPPAVAFVRSGKLRPIAVMSKKRSPALPDVPTVAEQGHPGFEADTWFAIFAPAKVPADVLDRLNAEINKALVSRPVVERFETLSLEAQVLDRAATRSYVAGEVAKWSRLVKDIGVKVE